ncbi:MAG: SprT-like domain-containing protein [Bacteroidota bacterium]
MNERDKISQALEKYVPEAFVAYVTELLFSETVHFKVSKPRRTKHGDYRSPHNNKPHRISVNGDLNPYAFLITTIHEFAHMKTFINHGSGVRAHGKEWKAAYRELLLPILESDQLPESIKNALTLNLNNMRASSCTDAALYRALKKFDHPEENVFLLEELQNGDFFRLGKNVFKRGALRRTRFICEELYTEKKYLVSKLAEVEPIKMK